MDYPSQTEEIAICRWKSFWINIQSKTREKMTSVLWALCSLNVPTDTMQNALWLILNLLKMQQKKFNLERCTYPEQGDIDWTGSRLLMFIVDFSMLPHHFFIRLKPSFRSSKVLQWFTLWKVYMDFFYSIVKKMFQLNHFWYGLEACKLVSTP